jgi:hypothetical protein
MRETKSVRSTISRSWLSLAFALVAFVCGAACASAQRTRESRTPRLERDCPVAVQALASGIPAANSTWALSMIDFCDESGGAVLNALWTTPTTDPIALEQLVQASSRLLDQRVYNGVIAAARNVGLSRDVRIAAIRVLTAYLNNRTVIGQQDLAKPSSDTTITAQFAVAGGGIGQSAGSQPLAASVPADIRTFLQSLVTDSDPILRQAGRNLTAWFQHH